MAAVIRKTKQPIIKGMAQCKEIRGTASNLKIHSIYPKRKYTAAIIGM